MSQPTSSSSSSVASSHQSLRLIGVHLANFIHNLLPLSGSPMKFDDIDRVFQSKLHQSFAQYCGMGESLQSFLAKHPQLFQLRPTAAVRLTVPAAVPPTAASLAPSSLSSTLDDASLARLLYSALPADGSSVLYSKLGSLYQKLKQQPFPTKMAEFVTQHPDLFKVHPQPSGHHTVSRNTKYKRRDPSAIPSTMITAPTPRSSNAPTVAPTPASLPPDDTALAQTLYSVLPPDGSSIPFSDLGGLFHLKTGRHFPTFLFAFVLNYPNLFTHQMQQEVRIIARNLNYLSNTPAIKSSSSNATSVVVSNVPIIVSSSDTKASTSPAASSGCAVEKMILSVIEQTPAGTRMNNFGNAFFSVMKKQWKEVSKESLRTVIERLAEAGILRLDDMQPGSGPIVRLANPSQQVSSSTSSARSETTASPLAAPSSNTRLPVQSTVAPPAVVMKSSSPASSTVASQVPSPSAPIAQLTPTTTSPPSVIINAKKSNFTPCVSSDLPEVATNAMNVTPQTKPTTTLAQSTITPAFDATRNFAAVARAVPAPRTFSQDSRFAREASPAAMSSTFTFSSASPSNQPIHKGTASLGRTYDRRNSQIGNIIDKLTVAYQTARHQQGEYPGPIESVYDFIITQPEFLAASDQIPGVQSGIVWTRNLFVERLLTATIRNRRVFDAPDMLQELYDLLDQVTLYCSAIVQLPVETLFDVSKELPQFLNKQCHPIIFVNESNGKEHKGFNRLEKYRWNFRSYDDLRLGAIQNHPILQKYFHIPPDLRQIASITKEQVLAFTASWLPTGKTTDLIQSGALNEGKLLEKIQIDPLFKGKIAASKPSRPGVMMKGGEESSTSSSTSSSISDSQYLSLFIGRSFLHVIRMLKQLRHRGMEFQKNYSEKKGPEFEEEIRERCNERFRIVHERLKEQIQPTEHLYRETTKKMREFMMEVPIDDSIVPTDMNNEVTNMGVDDAASALVQRSFQRRQLRIESLKSHLNRVFKLTDSSSHSIPNHSPLAQYHRLLVSAVPILVDLISDRLMFITDPDMVKRLDKKRQERIESGELVEEKGVSDLESDADEADEKKSSFSSRPSREHNGSARSHRRDRCAKNTGLTLETEDGETMDGDFMDEPQPYSENALRSKMHQMDVQSAAAVANSTSPPKSLSVLGHIRLLQSLMWRSYCELNSEVDESEVPSLFEWLEKQPDSMQAIVENWAMKRAGVTLGTGSTGASSATSVSVSAPVYTKSEILQFLASCVINMQMSSFWSQWEKDAGTTIKHDDQHAQRILTPIELIKACPPALRRLMRAVEMQFGAVDVGHGSLTDLLDQTPSHVTPTSNVCIVPLAQLLLSTPIGASTAGPSRSNKISPCLGRRDGFEYMTFIPAHRSSIRPATTRDSGREAILLFNGVTSDAQVSRAIAALVRVPMLSDIAEMTQWTTVFEAELGRIEVFVRTYAAEILEAIRELEQKITLKRSNNASTSGFLLLQLSSGVLVRLDGSATAASLSQCSSSHRFAVQFASLVAHSGSFREVDAAALTDSIRKVFPRLGAIESAVSFLLESLSLLPQSLVIPCSELLFPLLQATWFNEKPEALFEALIEAAMKAANTDSTVSSQLHRLHFIGIQMQIPSIVQHFGEWNANCEGQRTVPQAITVASTEALLERASTFQVELLEVEESTAALDSLTLVDKDWSFGRSNSTNVKSENGDTNPSNSSISSSIVPSSSSTSPRDVISSIRKLRGLDSDIEQTETDAAKNALIHSALELLSTELYQSGVHFVAECVQNSDDNQYLPSSGTPTLVFRLGPSELLIVNNERPCLLLRIVLLYFRMGINFNSVWMNSHHRSLLLNVHNETSEYVKLPISHSADKWHTLRRELTDMFEPTLLLFLRQVRCIVLEQVTDPSRMPTTMILRRSHSELPNICMVEERYDGPGVDDGRGGALHRFLVVKASFKVPDAQREQLRWQNLPTQSTEIVIAFPLSTGPYQYPLPVQKVFAFLPARSYGFKFILHADFVLPSSRDTLSESSARNSWILEKIPLMMTLIVETWKEHMRLGTPGVDLLTFFHFLPAAATSRSSDVDYGFFRATASAMMKSVASLQCVKDDRTDVLGETSFVKPSTVFSTPYALVRALISSDLLFSMLDRRWLHSSLQPLPESLKESLGIVHFDALTLIDLIRLKCRAYESECKGSTTTNVKVRNSKKTPTTKAARKAERAAAKAERKRLKKAIKMAKLAETLPSQPSSEPFDSKPDGSPLAASAATAATSLSESKTSEIESSSESMPSVASADDDAINKEEEEEDDEHVEEQDDDEEDGDMEESEHPMAAVELKVETPLVDPSSDARAASHRIFLARALLALDTLLRATPDREALIAKLKHLPICPLVDGSFVSCQASNASVQGGSGTQQVLMREFKPASTSDSSFTQMPSERPVSPWSRVLEAPLLILHPDVFQAVSNLNLSSIGLSSSSNPVTWVRNLLLELGVRPIDDHFILQSAITKMRSIASSMESQPRIPGASIDGAVRDHCRATILSLHHHIASGCTNSECRAQRKDLAQCAVVELSTGELVRLADVRSRIITDAQYSNSKLSLGLVKLRDELPSKLGTQLFVTLSPCYLQLSVQSALACKPLSAAEQISLRATWSSFFAQELKITDMFPITQTSEAINLTQIRQDPRAKDWSEVFHQSFAETDGLIIDAHCPPLLTLFEVCASLTHASSPVLVLAHHLLDEMISVLCANWSTYAPFSMIRWRQNVTDFDLVAVRSTDVTFTAPSSFGRLLQQSAWIPSIMVRRFIPQPCSVSAPTTPFVQPSALFLPTQYNEKFLPPDAWIYQCSSAEQITSPLFKFIGIKAEISPLDLYHLLVNVWSHQSEPFHSSLSRMAVIYQLLKQNRFTPVPASGNKRGTVVLAQQKRYGRSLPDSAPIEDESLGVIGDIFDPDSEVDQARLVIWMPYPSDLPPSDTTTIRPGYFISPKQIVSFDAKPEILNNLANDTDWCSLPTSMYVSKHAYRPKSGEFWRNIKKTPYLEPLTIALGRLVERLQEKQTTFLNLPQGYDMRARSDQAQSLRELEEKCVISACRWRQYVSQDLLNSHYAQEDDMVQERERVIDLLHKLPLFPCFRSGEDIALRQVHFVTLSESPILNDRTDIAKRFLSDQSGIPSSLDGKPVYFLIFLQSKTEAWTIEALEHEKEKLVWDEYKLKKLSSMCERRSVVEVSNEALPNTLHTQMQGFVRCVQKYLFVVHSEVYNQLTAAGIASLLDSYDIIPCSHLDYEWTIAGISSEEREHASVVLQMDEKRICVHRRDFKMQEPTLMGLITDALVDIICTSLPSSAHKLSSDLSKSLREFLCALLPHRENLDQMRRASEEMYEGSKTQLPTHIQPWSFSRAKSSTSSSGTLPFEVSRRIVKDGSLPPSTKDLFGVSAPAIITAPEAVSSGMGGGIGGGYGVSTFSDTGSISGGSVSSDHRPSGKTGASSNPIGSSLAHLTSEGASIVAAFPPLEFSHNDTQDVLGPEQVIPDKLQQLLRHASDGSDADASPSSLERIVDSSSSSPSVSPHDLARRMASWSNQFVNRGGVASMETLALIGRWGECMVYQLLLAEESSKTGGSSHVVKWCNESVESGGPYDLTLCDSSDGSIIRYIEVKSTTSSDIDAVPFDISASEVAASLKYRGQFEIWRVTCAGTPSASYRVVKDPALMWHRKHIRVQMDIKPTR